jgi:hypothetical protein
MRIAHESKWAKITVQQTYALNKSIPDPISGQSPVVYCSCKAVISRGFYGVVRPGGGFMASYAESLIVPYSSHALKD